MIIQVRRGLEASRTSYTPQAGEPIFTTDEKKLYVGDGVTPGGILVDMQSGVQTIIAGTNITVDATDPANPIVSATLDSAVDSVNGLTGTVVLDTDDISDTAQTNKWATAGEKTKLGYIAVTQAVDLDAMESTLASHVADTANPHSVTKAQVGLSNVPNTDFTAAVAANTAKISFDSASSTKLGTIETGADVTDTANVTSAGALMDSEVTNLAQVKAFSSADYATAAQGATADSAVQPGDLATVATTGVYSDLTGKPTIPTSVDNLSPAQATHGGKFLKTDGTNATWESIPGGGDMLASTYDPQNIADDAFDQDNMTDGATNKNYTATEKTKLAGVETAADVTDTANVTAAGALMDSEVTNLAAVKAFDPASYDAAGAAAAAQAASQPLDSGLTTIAGLTATSDNVIQSVAGSWASRTMAQLKTALALVKGDVGLGNVDNTSDATKNAASAALTNKDLSSATNTMPTGVLVGFGYSQSSAVATGTTVIPQDDTIPQITEGNEYMTLAYTPKSTTNLLEIEVNIFVSSSTSGGVMTTALFQDAIANALAASSNFTDTVATFATRPLVVRYVMAADTTSPITFRVRAGTHNAGTTTFNGAAGSGRYGAAIKSAIIVREYKA